MRASSLAAWFAPLLGGLLCLLAGGCGFQLRGAYALPYESLYLDMPAYSEVRAGLKRAIGNSGPARLVDRAEDAQALFRPTGEARERVILSLSSAGRVRELRLNFRYSYRVTDPLGRDLTPPVAILLSRDMSYDDANVLSKEQEEALLWRDMQNDLLQQVLRRLAAAKPVPPPVED